MLSNYLIQIITFLKHVRHSIQTVKESKRYENNILQRNENVEFEVFEDSKEATSFLLQSL